MTGTFNKFSKFAVIVTVLAYAYAIVRIPFAPIELTVKKFEFDAGLGHGGKFIPAHIAQELGYNVGISAQNTTTGYWLGYYIGAFVCLIYSGFIAYFIINIVALLLIAFMKAIGLR